MKPQTGFIILILLVVSALFLFQPLTAAPSPKAKDPNAINKSLVERGKYLTTIIGCEDCHTPKKMTAHGPVEDESRRYSGHPANEKLPKVPDGVLAPGGWTALSNMHLTSWAGPWGISYSFNLTPDLKTGIGSWTEEMFISALRTGRHLGAPDGRMILPPMPWHKIGQMTDEDLKAVFAYLRTLKPIENAVPDPVPPASESEKATPGNN